MYQQMLTICSPDNRARGPSVDPGVILSSPDLRENCLDDITFTSQERFSVYVFELMDRLGYSREMMEHRQQVYSELDIKITRQVLAYNQHFTNAEKEYNPQVTTGGKGEGTALYYESDTDFMFAIEGVICTDNPQCHIYSECALFFTERHDAPAGYTYLKLIGPRIKQLPDRFKRSLIESENGVSHLSSQLYVNDLRNQLIGKDFEGLRTHKRSGPSVPCSSGPCSYDTVHCIKCICQDILERWINRPRHYGWPSQDTITEISRLDGHVVPVGMKGSKNMHMEWRICYSLAELHLMWNLNDTQIKLYIILKKLCKSVINPVCKDMTSYIMKNVVFWVCEQKGIRQFKPNMLMNRLFDCINYLNQCIRNNNLPSYMIPERNLLAEKIDLSMKERLTSILNGLLSKGGSMILGFEKLSEAIIVIHLVPEMLREFSEKRDDIEKDTLKVHEITVEIGVKSQGMSLMDMLLQLDRNQKYRDIKTRQHQLMNFNVQVLKREGKSDEDIDHLTDRKIVQLLS